MPLLDINKVVCNCGNVSRQRKVVLESCAAASAVSDLQKLSIPDEDGDDYEEFFESSGEEEEEYEEFAVDIPHVNDHDCESVEFTCDSNMANSAETLFTESFTLKGSSYHQHFQRGLKSCKEQLMQKISVSIKLRFEPINRRDENAILVPAYPGNSWEPIGYIPGIKVPKMTQAVRNEEITSMTIKSVRYQYIFPISSFKYFATVTISKRGKWLKNKDLYKYNEEL